MHSTSTHTHYREAQRRSNYALLFVLLTMAVVAAHLLGDVNDISISTTLAAVAASAATTQETRPKKQQRHDTNTTTQYYYLHIPKAAGNTMLRSLNRYRKNTIKDFGPGHEFDNDGIPFDTWAQRFPQHRVFMSEGGGFQKTNHTIIQHSLTMLRDPVSHVISQYFHCKEADVHGNYYRVLPETLLEWLEAWDDIQRQHPEIAFATPNKTRSAAKSYQFLQHQKRLLEKAAAANVTPAFTFTATETNTTATTITSRHHHHREYMGMRHFESPGPSAVRHADPNFQCYIPLNLQSWKILGRPVQSKQELMERFDVVGIQSDFDKSACLFLVQLHQHIPAICDCTHAAEHPSQNVPAVTHGVEHHGSFYNVTSQELALIHRLTVHDRKLYTYGEELFQEKIQLLETKYGVKLCGTPTLSSPHQRRRQWR